MRRNSRRRSWRAGRQQNWRLMVRWCVRGFAFALILALVTIALAALVGPGDAGGPQAHIHRRV
jgi:hypothetical protein